MGWDLRILANEIVKYNNRMNTVPLKKFNSIEMDLFYSLCSQIKNKGSENITLTFEQLKSLSHYKPTANSRFIEDLRKTNKKLMSLQFTFEDENLIEDFVLFTTFSINKNKEELTISVNKRFDFIFNQLTGSFTRFELEELTSLESKYSKIMYRHLKQWRTKGRYKGKHGVMLIDEFKDLLNVPKSYQMANIDKKVLDPITKELSSIFKNLKIEKLKRGRGNKVIGFIITFQPESKNQQNKLSSELALTNTHDNTYDYEEIEKNIEKNMWK